MKKLYTSNYKRCGQHPDAISISFTVPSSYHGKTLGKLAPLGSMIGEMITSGDMRTVFTTSGYTRDYLNLLEERNIKPQALVDELPDGAILLCYENPGEFCHRRILANWIYEHTGVIIPEWKSEKEIKKAEQNKVVDNLIDF